MLRSELLNGVLHPGQKLKMVELTERFGVSQSVVREALTRLTEQGLLVATPQRGFRVRDLSIEDIAELTETRIQIESLAYAPGGRSAATCSGRPGSWPRTTASNGRPSPGTTERSARTGPFSTATSTRPC